MREVYDFELLQALVEIDRTVGLDGAVNRVGMLLVAVELVIVMGLTRRLEPLRSMRSPKHLQPLRSTRSTRHLGLL